MKLPEVHSRRRPAEEQGIRRRHHEVHCNTREGHWLGLRNFLRPFRGVSKWCLDLYAGFDLRGSHDVRRDFLGFLQRLFGAFTPNGP